MLHFPIKLCGVEDNGGELSIQFDFMLCGYGVRVL